MLLLQGTNIKKSYGVKTVLDFEGLQVYEGDKIGIVGANGSGKSTLMGILYGDIVPDEGTVIRNCQAAYIRQFFQGEDSRSGGENAKGQILTQTLTGNHILFADEPTANLDEDGQQWVATLLEQAKTVLLVSHDRALLDRICNKIIVLKDGELKTYTGNFTRYQQEAAAEETRHQLAYVEYQQKKSQLERAIQTKDRKVSSMHARKVADYKKNESEARLGRAKRATKQKKVEQGGTALKARLERLPKVEKRREPPRLRIDFSLTQPPGNKHVVTCNHLDFSYGDHTVFKDASFLIPNRKKVAVTGKNGAGKSTLLRLIREGHQGIVTAPKLRPGYLYQGFENLREGRTVLENVMLSSVQDVATARSVLAGLLFFGDDVHKQVSVLSGGEKMRLSLAKLLTSNANALILDEPTNYLDLPSVEAVQQVIIDYPGTVVLVSHDEAFVRHVADMQLRIEDSGIRQIPVQQTSAPAASPDKTLLEIRLTRLVAEIGAAPPEQKDLLEAQYHQVLEQLRKC